MGKAHLDQRKDSRLVLPELAIWVDGSERFVAQLEQHRLNLLHLFAVADADILGVANYLSQHRNDLRINEAAATMMLVRAFRWLGAARTRGLLAALETPKSHSLASELFSLRNMHEHPVEYQLDGEGKNQKEYVRILAGNDGSVTQGTDGPTILGREMYISNRIALSDMRDAIEELKEALEKLSPPTKRSFPPAHRP